LDRHEYAYGTEEHGQSQTKHGLVTSPSGNGYEKTKIVLACPELCIFYIVQCYKEVIATNQEEADCHGKTNQGILFLSGFWAM